MCTPSTSLTLSHTTQVVHGDLKSGNVLVDRALGAHIADFGLVAGPQARARPRRSACAMCEGHAKTSGKGKAGGRLGKRRERREGMEMGEGDGEGGSCGRQRVREPNAV